MKKALLSSLTAMALLFASQTAATASVTGVGHNSSHTLRSTGHKNRPRDHKGSGSTRIVRFKFTGKVDSYQASGSSGANGSITITVSGSNLDHQSVKGMVMTFGVSSQTSIVNNGPAPTPGEKVKVYVSAPKDTVFAGSSGSSGTAVTPGLTAVKLIFSAGD